MASVTQTHIPTCAVVLLLSLFKTVVYVAVFVASKKTTKGKSGSVSKAVQAID